MACLAGAVWLPFLLLSVAIDVTSGSQNVGQGAPERCCLLDGVGGVLWGDATRLGRSPSPPGHPAPGDPIRQVRGAGAVPWWLWDNIWRLRDRCPDPAGGERGFWVSEEARVCALRAPSTLWSATFLGGEVRAASLRRQNQGMAGELLAEGGSGVLSPQQGAGCSPWAGPTPAAPGAGEDITRRAPAHEVSGDGAACLSLILGTPLKLMSRIQRGP